MPSKKIVRIDPFKELIASGVQSGNVITLAGQVSVDSQGRVVGWDDICAQVHQSYLNVKEVLTEFDAAPEIICDETWFVTNIAEVMLNVEELLKIREEVLGVPLKDVSHTLIQVSGLVEPELSVEVKCICVL